LAISLLLVALAIGLSMWRGLGLERSIAWATVRALAQLIAVGLALQVLLEPDTSIAWSILWVLAMIVFAAETVRRRARDVPEVFPLALAAFGTAAVVVLGILFGLGIFDLDARTLISLDWMLIGNSMRATVLVARRVVE
jgi:putative ABC transport system permease protein